MKNTKVNDSVFKVTKGEKGKKATLVGEVKKSKPLPNKSIKMGGFFVGKSTT